MKSRLILYDTSNYIDFPIGGELTSISNFLRYLVKQKREVCDQVMLVGVTTDPKQLGKFKKVQIGDIFFSMLPVAIAEKDLSHTQKSLRAQYMKGILKYGKQLKIRKSDCNYIHTAEAYGAVKILNPMAICVIFSHGSYFNMERGFRFYRNNPFVRKGFMLYVRLILRNAKMIFVLDDDSEQAYQRLNKHVVRAMNSIVCLEERRMHKPNGYILFVGRLSKDKNIKPIIDAVNQMKDQKLLIIGDGEEYENLCPYKSDKIQFVGAVAPVEVKEYMKDADILVMNSVFEGVPMTILEALSLGVPVVSTPVGGIPSVLTFGEDSEETDGSAEAIKCKIEKIYARYDAYSLAAFQHAQKFDYKKVNEDIFKNLSKYWNV